MAAPGRPENPAVDLERCAGGGAAARASRSVSTSSRRCGCWGAFSAAGSRSGRFSSPRDEVVRFGAHPHSWRFPPARSQAIDWPETRQPLMRVNFMGLIGPAGRAAAVLHRAWCWSACGRRTPRSRLLRYLQSPRDLAVLPGLGEVPFHRGLRARRRRPAFAPPDGSDRAGHPRLRDRQHVRDDSLSSTAGSLLAQTRSALALRHAAVDYFGVPVEIEQFVGAWHALEADTQCRFEREPRRTPSTGFGRGGGRRDLGPAIAGAHPAGPLTLAQYRDFSRTEARTRRCGRWSASSPATNWISRCN